MAASILKQWRKQGTLWRSLWTVDRALIDDGWTERFTMPRQLTAALQLFVAFYGEGAFTQGGTASGANASFRLYPDGDPNNNLGTGSVDLSSGSTLYFSNANGLMISAPHYGIPLDYIDDSASARGIYRAVWGSDQEALPYLPPFESFEFHKVTNGGTGANAIWKLLEIFAIEME